jgi:signal transduction histidine kinase
METRLAQIQVETETDILEIHQQAIEIATQRGLPVIEQIRFASAVAEKCILARGKRQHVTFSVAQTTDGQFCLKASLGADPTCVEQELVQIILPHPLPHKQIAGRKTGRNEKNYKDMEQFTFALAHDLKNSLTKLKLALSLVEEEELQPPLDTYMLIIHRAAERFERILLSLNKVIQLGNTSPEVIKTISPQQVFANAREEFAEQLTDCNAIVTVDFSRAASFNYIEVHLQSVFSNLLSNAIKYASPDRQLHISVTGEKEADKISMSFADNGQGINLDMHGDKLFAPFTRFSDARDGSGIGLYIVKTIVERNGGTIEVSSVLRQGTTFRFVLNEYELPV